MTREMKQGQVELFGWHLDSYLFVWKGEEEKIGPTAKQYIEASSNLKRRYIGKDKELLKHIYYLTKVQS